MTDVIGIDHIYITVSDLEASEQFYDRVMIRTLGFRKNKFSVAGDPHIQYFNRHFGFVLRPSRVLLAGPSSLLSTRGFRGRCSCCGPSTSRCRS